MTTKSATRIATADASVLSSVRGWPSWAVILLALGLTLAGTAVDGLTTGLLAWGLRIGFYLGVLSPRCWSGGRRSSPPWCSRRWSWWSGSSPG